MNNASLFSTSISWIFGAVILVLGFLNLILVHPVPGIIYIVLSLLLFPPVSVYMKNSFGFALPFIGKVLLFLVIMWFTLGISDLGEMYGF